MKCPHCQKELSLPNHIISNMERYHKRVVSITKCCSKLVSLQPYTTYSVEQETTGRTEDDWGNKGKPPKHYSIGNGEMPPPPPKPESSKPVGLLFCKRCRISIGPNYQGFDYCDDCWDKLKYKPPKPEFPADRIYGGDKVRTRDEAMDINSPPGTKVVFTGKGGYPSENELAHQYLMEGETYTVSSTVVQPFKTWVYLEEIQVKCFNSVHFIKPTS